MNATFKPVLAVKKLIDNKYFPRNVLMKYPMQMGLALFPLYYKWLVKYAYMGNISGYGRY